MSVPDLLLAIGDDSARTCLPGAALAAAGVAVIGARDAEEALAVLARSEVAAILLLEADRADGPAVAAAGSIRASAAPYAILRIVAATGGKLAAQLATAAVDCRIASPPTADALVTILRGWQAADRAATERRAQLAATFGDAYRALLAGLASQLRDALAAANTAAAAEAHRIAGLTGTLGFEDASAAWLDVSQGDDGALARARLEAGRVLATIEGMVDQSAIKLR